ncbi:NECAP-like protein CG9132 [Danaus plexippus]|uniref:Adaptin ear-binding coat-associated protein 1 n=1 Tax=Danaus plexippus plexippus TaxID=278856 RepID=A0A212ENZ0_DANPL|nr:NECAP-like protein CG9132 [Danaus plexippus]OWR43171.1 Adaptin ear-binding coat-associated protein 1 [Danaus plexippus plexippus]
MEAYESVLLVKNEVFVFKIPPRTSNRGYRAADWNLQEPQWTGRMRLVAKGDDLIMKLEDKTSGELFAKCPIDKYPGVALEAVTDSSRYFVVKIQDDNGRSAYIGLGFGDRSDSFDLNVALQDHFKWLRKEQEGEGTADQQQMDFSFKEGETIKINMKITKKDGSEASRPRRAGGANVGGLLPPPPGGSKLPPPPSPQHVPTPAGTPAVPNTEWGDFNSASAPPQPPKPTTPANQQNWVQF